MVQAGELTIDLVHRRVARAGEEIKLSPKEWDILEQLAIHAGRVVTHGQILAKVWGRATETEQQYLRVYLRQLRQKLEPEPGPPALARHRGGGRLPADGGVLSGSTRSVPEHLDGAGSLNDLALPYRDIGCHARPSHPPNRPSRSSRRACGRILRT